MNEKRLEILRLVERGVISVEEGDQLLRAMEIPSEEKPVSEPESFSGSEGDPQESLSGQVVSASNPDDDIPDFSRWKIWSWTFFALFVILTGTSAFWMVQGWQNHPFGWGFWLSWIPFIIGILGMAGTFGARWVHVRVRQADGNSPKTIAISLPLPLGLAASILNAFPQWMPENIRKQNIGMYLRELDKSISRDEPLSIHVEDEDGERVDVYIG